MHRFKEVGSTKRNLNSRRTKICQPKWPERLIRLPKSSLASISLSSRYRRHVTGFYTGSIWPSAKKLNEEQGEHGQEGSFSTQQ